MRVGVGVEVDVGVDVYVGVAVGVGVKVGVGVGEGGGEGLSETVTVMEPERAGKVAEGSAVGRADVYVPDSSTVHDLMLNTKTIPMIDHIIVASKLETT